MSENTIIALITAVGVILTAIVTFYNINKNIKIEQITKERAKWREEIRRISKDLVSLDYATKNPSKLLKITQKKYSLLAELEMRLNPYDEQDKEILRAAKEEFSDKGDQHKFIHLITCLLKHDWERAKRESSTFNVKRKIDIDSEHKQNLNCIQSIIYCFSSIFGIVFASFNVWYFYSDFAIEILLSISQLIAIISSFYIYIIYYLSKKLEFNIGFWLALAMFSVVFSYFWTYVNSPNGFSLHDFISLGMIVPATLWVVIVLCNLDN